MNIEDLYFLAEMRGIKKYGLKHAVLEMAWFKEIVKGDDIRKFIKKAEESGRDYPCGKWKDVLRRYYFFTDNYRYCIVAVDRSDDEGYLGCTVSCRKPRAGEDWTRGSDLPDGKFTQKTWVAIKNAIIRNEMVLLAPKVKEVVDEG